jgi:DNA-binding GntR family transcriptional regulator
MVLENRISLRNHGSKRITELVDRFREGLKMNVVVAQNDPEASLYEAILAEIAAGRLAGGQRLKVSEIAARYGLSTSPVREVLRRMQGEGYVDISPNRGATVRKADANTIQNIFEILQLLEPYFVTWFAEYARPEMLDEMEALQAQMRALTTPDLQTLRRLDSLFHGTISKYHYNQVALEQWTNLRRALNVHTARLRISPARFRAIIEEHDELLSAFRANDADWADRTLRKHIGGSYVQLSQQMRAMGL